MCNKESTLNQIEKLIMVKKENRYTFIEKNILVLICIMFAIICIDYPISTVVFTVFFLSHFHIFYIYSYNYEDLLMSIENIK